MWVIVYVALIVAVNYGFSVVPLVQLPGDLGARPPMSLAVGAIFVVRDLAQRQIGHWVIPAMLLGGLLSYWMADPYVAIASVTAFLVSELVDWAVYTWTRRPFRDRVLLSSALGTPVDSAIFLGMIGALTGPAVVLMTVSKMIAALLVWKAALTPHIAPQEPGESR